MRQNAWDGALVDLFLLQGSGLGVARAFAHRATTQKLFVVSNYATEKVRNRYVGFGVNGVFDKSTEPDLLMERLLRPVG